MSRLQYFMTMLICVGSAHAADLPEVSGSGATTTYEACRNAIAEWARAYDPIDCKRP